MESKIKVLDDVVINKIAAGEVIENSASVVKELVENALDAGATLITIECRGGGRQLIRISDNGSGMSADDALLSLERHATSKLRTIEDFDSLLTMGFRGEALASIASISKLTLITAKKEQTGTLLKVEGGKILFQGPVARDAGTTFEIKDLFYNVPVRKKFLKAPSQDNIEILRVVTLFAFARPDVSFHLLRDGVSSLQLHPSTLEERIRLCLGEDFLLQTFPISCTQGEISLTGYVGGSRPNRREQYLFINNRAVVSPQIAKAVKEAFGTTLSSDRFPLFVLHLKVPSHGVDVNVHPQKREVRFAREEELLFAIQSAISAALMPTKAPPKMQFRVQQAHFSLPQPKVEDLQITHPLPQFVDSPLPLPEHERGETPHVIATLPGNIIVEKNGRFFLIHQRRAHHRVLFERVREEKWGEQLLLIPYVFSVTPADQELLTSHLAFLENVGLTLREVGKNRFAIDSIPTLFSGDSLETLIHSLLEDVREGYFKREGDEAIIRLSNYAALKMNVRLSNQEAEELLKRLAECTNSTLSPQGEPIQKEINETLLGQLWNIKSE